VVAVVGFLVVAGDQGGQLAEMPAALGGPCGQRRGGEVVDLAVVGVQPEVAAQ
jgi:hypothetical protein